MKNKNNKFVLATVIPLFTEVAIFMVIPIIGTLLISFMDYSPLRDSNMFVGIENYKALLTDESFIIALKNTLFFTFVAVAINIVISLAIAFLISQLRSNKTRSFFRMMMFLPCIAPMVASSVVWVRTIFPKNGLLNQLLIALGANAISFTGDANYLMSSVIVFTLWADLGYNIILFCAGIDGIPTDIYEAAELDGASQLKRFFKITLPLLARTMAFVTLMTLISYFQMFAQFEVLAVKGGPKQSGLVLTSYIYKTAFGYRKMGYAAAISVVLFIVILIVSIIQKRMDKVDWEY
ncbi:MAG: sugar ABC transporter permease [Firmicutes bacterium]|nr:sugar ABC transporter permease [Candidatus Colivicinus equi]